MKFTAREDQVVLAGRVGSVEVKTDSLVIVSVSHRKNRDETEWTNVAFTNPKSGQNGAKLADLAQNYITKGQYVTVVANKVENGQYENYYAVAVDLGPKSQS
jgi:hypothetical protein